MYIDHGDEIRNDWYKANWVNHPFIAEHFGERTGVRKFDHCNLALFLINLDSFVARKNILKRFLNFRVFGL